MGLVWLRLCGMLSERICRRQAAKQVSPDQHWTLGLGLDCRNRSRESSSAASRVKKKIRDWCRAGFHLNCHILDSEEGCKGQTNIGATTINHFCATTCKNIVDFCAIGVLHKLATHACYTCLLCIYARHELHMLNTWGFVYLFSFLCLVFVAWCRGWAERKTKVFLNTTLFASVQNLRFLWHPHQFFWLQMTHYLQIFKTIICFSNFLQFFTSQS